MADLDTLRPEVRDAMDRLRKCVLCCEPSLDPGLATVRAELLRLEGVEKVRDEVCAIWARDKASAVRYLDRAEKAEAELEALKARIAESAHVDVTLGCAIDGEILPDLALCKVALVRVEK